MEPEITTTTNNNGEFPHSTPDLPNPSYVETAKSPEDHDFPEDIDSSCSTPYVSAPSSPGRGPVGFFYSAPASPMHFVLSKLPSSSSTTALSSSSNSNPADASVSGSFEFEFSARFASNWSGTAGSMCSADELFLNGQIRPMKLSTHLQRPQVLAPLLDVEEGESVNDVENDAVEVEAVRGRDLRLRDRSLRRRTRSMSPLRSCPFPWHNDDDDREALRDNQSNIEKTGLELEGKEGKEYEAPSMESTPSMSASSSRSSSAGRSSKRWVFLKDFLYRSKSEGRSSNTKFWASLTFSPAKEKKVASAQTNPFMSSTSSSKGKVTSPAPAAATAETPSKTKKRVKEPSKKPAAGKLANGVGKRRIPPSPHELHYTANRAQAEELRKKTFLPYRQGLLGCLGFSSRSYGAMNGFARALNPVSSRAVSLLDYWSNDMSHMGQ